MTCSNCCRRVTDATWVEEQLIAVTEADVEKQIATWMVENQSIEPEEQIVARVVENQSIGREEQIVA
jgi:hypothetical protein